MPQNTPYSELKEAINRLEHEQAVQGQLLKVQIKDTIDSLNPFNVLKSTFDSITESSEIKKTLLGLIIPVVTGIISKRAFAGTSRPAVIKQAGIVALNWMNGYVANNPEFVKTLGLVFLKVFKRKKASSENKE